MAVVRSPVCLTVDRLLSNAHQKDARPPTVKLCYCDNYCPSSSIRRFRNYASVASGLRSLSGGTGRAFSLEVASFALTKKNRRPRRHFEHTFSLDLAILACKLARPRFPGTPRASIFESKKAGFSRFLRAASVRHAKHSTSTKPCKNQCETHFGASSH